MAAYLDIYPDLEDQYPTRRDIYSLSDAKFYRLYRFDKSTFSYIVDLIRTDLQRPTARSYGLSCEIQTAAAIRYYASGTFQTDVGEGLSISQSSVHRCILNVGTALNKLYDEFITWPDREQIRKNKLQFYNIARFPNVIGAIDCTHVRIMRPSTDEHQYINRKFYPSLNVQAICGPTGFLHNMEVNWPGSCHDSFILRESNVYLHLEASPFHGYILGDSAYPLTQWLLTPFSNPDTPQKHAFNLSHKKTRVLIENTFGRLKRRFHLLHSENRHPKIGDIVRDIRACGILHNIAVSKNQPDLNDNVSDDQPAPLPYIGPLNCQANRMFVANQYFS